MTRKTLSKLPAHIRSRIESFKEAYYESGFSSFVRARTAGYLEGLKDAGLITESERKVLFTYATL